MFLDFRAQTEKVTHSNKFWVINSLRELTILKCTKWRHFPILYSILSTSRLISEQETYIYSNKKDKLLFSQGKKKSLFIYFENNSRFNFFITACADTISELLVLEELGLLCYLNVLIFLLCSIVSFRKSIAKKEMKENIVIPKQLQMLKVDWFCMSLNLWCLLYSSMAWEGQMCNEGNMKFRWIKETETLYNFRLNGPMT